jgi:hypothetical protein
MRYYNILISNNFLIDNIILLLDTDFSVLLVRQLLMDNHHNF